MQLIDSGKIQPCKAVDLGCGTGNYTIFLANRGFDATGIDMSPAAIEIARKNAGTKNVTCLFIVADIVKEPDKVRQKFDFAFDWNVLHHVYPQDREQYVKNVYHMLNPKGTYLSVSFSEKDESFETSGKYRKTSIGSVLYFSSEEELRELFSSYFNIIEMKTIEIQSKSTPHVHNVVLMTRK